ncbi:MAG: penicillin-binding transpeptidase domain-containing protein [Desulfomonilaceae bacterium]|jgi:cell division protein FtsI (penicillin-binding protein 3)
MFRNEKSINWMVVRIAIVACVFAVASAVLIARAYRLQIVDSDTLKKRAEKQRAMNIHLEARRGFIFDRTGEQLAASLEVDSVYARPRKLVDQSERTQTADTLSRILDMDKKEILNKLDEPKPFVWIKRRVSPVTAEKVRKSNLSGIYTDPEYQRFYPLKNLASHTIGFAGIDSRGLEGLELFYDKFLKTAPIPVTAQKDNLGRRIMFAATDRSPERNDVHITLDRNIQFIVERELEAAVNREHAKSGVVIVLDEDSGEILALAVRPTFNLNVFEQSAAGSRRNRAVADIFEPGSTFKVFLAATALDLGKVNRSDVFFVNNGLYRYNGSEIHDVSPHKNLTFDEVLINSSNIGAVKVSEKISKTEYYHMLKEFGFGSLTNVDLPGERPGILPKPSHWSVLTKANMAFGQGISVTPIQLAIGFAAAINGGKLYKPRLLKSITNALGETVFDNPALLLRRTVSEETSSALVDILRKTVVQGTGKGASIPGVDIIGKTGTAQKADSAGGYSKDRYLMSFLGAIQSAKPRVVILVLIDEPASGNDRTGGKVAAPVFKRIAEGILALSGSSPRSTGQLVENKKPVGKIIDACVTSFNPKPGMKPGEWVMPDLKGSDIREVVDVCGKMKCDLSIEGVGHVARQNPKPGETVREGAPIKISCSGGIY